MHFHSNMGYSWRKHLSNVFFFYTRLAVILSVWVGVSWVRPWPEHFHFRQMPPKSLRWATRWQFHAQQQQQRQEEKLDKRFGGLVQEAQSMSCRLSSNQQLSCSHSDLPHKDAWWSQNVSFFYTAGAALILSSLLSRCLFLVFCYLYLWRTEQGYCCMTVWSFLEQSTL